MNFVSALAAVVIFATVATAADVEGYGRTIASLISPTQLATLGKRGANPRVQKAVAYLHEAQVEGLKPNAVLDDALARVKMTGKAAQMTKDGLLRNLKIADELGVLDDEGMQK